MPRFPNFGHPRNPQVGTGGFVVPGAPTTPVPDPIKTGGIGGNVSFTVGGPTLQALRERQQRLQETAPEVPTMAGMQSPWQGAAYLANTLVNSLQQNAAAAAEERGTRAMMDVFGKIDPATGATAEQMAAIGQYDPEFAIKLWSDRAERLREAAKQDTYGPVITGDEAKALGLDPAKSYQLNKATGQYDQVGGGGTNVTINPPSAETAAKLGLAQGFTDNYDEIIRSAKAGEMTGVGYIKAVQFGRGPGGAAYRNLLQGTEALIRLLTGAGMSQSEAESRVRQYEPDATDDANTLVSKIQGLKQAIDNVKQGVETRGQPQGGGGGGDTGGGGGGTEPPPPDESGGGGTTPPPVDENDPQYQAAKQHYLEGGGTDAGWAYLTKNGRWKTFVVGGSNASNP